MIIITHTQHWRGYDSHYLMETLGRAMLRVTQTKNEFEISDLYVEENSRKRGLGSTLLQQAIALCQRLSEHGTIDIMVNDNSEGWVSKWYEELGFQLDRLETSLGSEEPEWYKVYRKTF